MLSTKNLVNDHKSIDSRWVFEHFCKLGHKLTGQDVKIKSIFNDKDHTPSMTIYCHDVETKLYKFNDFSTGYKGSHIDLVKYIKNVNFFQAVNIITEEYNEYVLKNKSGYDIKDFKEQGRYSVSSHELRQWNTKDSYFWTQFFIGSTFLNEYFIKPLSSYTMSKQQDGALQEIKITGEYIYGYFTKEGDLYKIYQPKVRDKKYIKVKSYIQGIDQLKGHDVLIIQAGMKDIGAFKSLKLKTDNVAPDSENTMIPKELMIKWKKEYKWIFVLFDNDDAGIKAMKKYRELYGISCILLTLGKDIADSVQVHKPKKVREKLVPLIDARLC